MQAALFLVLLFPPPAAGALMLVGADGAGAGRAADRGEAAIDAARCRECLSFATKSTTRWRDQSNNGLILIRLRARSCSASCVSERSTDCSTRRPVIHPSAPASARPAARPCGRGSTPAARRLNCGSRQCLARREVFFDAGAVRREGANAFAVARFRLAPDVMRFRKQSSRLQRYDVDIKILRENSVNDGLVLDPEAGREHEPPGDSLARRPQPAEQIQGAGAVRKLCCQHCRDGRGFGRCGKRDVGGGLSGHGMPANWMKRP